MGTPYIPPTFELTSFNCPYCNAFAAQEWTHLYQVFQSGNPFEQAAKAYHMSKCHHCRDVAMWHNGIMLVPDVSTAPQPHADMPESVVLDYEEARSVLQRSPRSAAALLRLALQKLCVELGEKGENINDDIASLVKKGLPAVVQKALDIIRVIGNEQVHPGQIDVRDDPETAVELFRLINFIVEDQITRPKSIDALYGRLPPKKLDGIEQRDKKTQPKTTTP